MNVGSNTFHNVHIHHINLGLNHAPCPTHNTGLLLQERNYYYHK